MKKDEGLMSYLRDAAICLVAFMCSSVFSMELQCSGEKRTQLSMPKELSIRTE